MTERAPGAPVHIVVREPGVSTAVGGGQPAGWPGNRNNIQSVRSYPNPFNPHTNIAFELPEPGQVSLSIYNVRGRLVSTLLTTTLGPGRHEIGWDGTDENGRVVHSGVYLYRIGGPNFSLLTSSERFLSLFEENHLTFG